MFGSHVVAFNIEFYTTLHEFRMPAKTNSYRLQVGRSGELSVRVAPEASHNNRFKFQV